MRYYYKCLDDDDKIRFIKEMGLKGYTYGHSGRDYHSYLTICGPYTNRWPVALIDDVNKLVVFGLTLPPNTPEYRSSGNKVYNMDRFRFI